MFGTQKGIVDEKKIDELLERGVAEIIPSKDSLKKLLMSGSRLRIKLGVDPTSSNIHTGRAVTLLKLRDFQELGHEVVFIAGDFTAVIGDTSDKEAERPMLSPQEIEKNMKTYKEQVGKILDLKKTEFRKNSEWLGKLTYKEIGEHADIFSVSDFIARDNIKRRLGGGKRVSLREILYPLMQGYDSVAVKADVELGGVDQRFNVLAGRPLQEHFGQKPQHALLFSLVTDPSGKKMSSSWGNTINITDTPDDMFGKTMSVPDQLVEQYFISMTRKAREEITKLLAGHPRDAKLALAYEFVRMYHGEKEAQKAQENFISIFSKKEVPEQKKVIEVDIGTTYVEAIQKIGFTDSKNKARELIVNGAVTSTITGEKIQDSNATIEKTDHVKVGKRNFGEFKVK